MDFHSISNTKDIFFKPAWELYEDAFPKTEKRFLEEQEKTLKKEPYTFNAIFDNNIFIGILGFWEIDEYVFIEHFAINPKLRGQNYGSTILNTFLKKYSNIILEIEPPLDTLSLRRLHFYEKLGFVQNKINHFQVPFRKDDKGIPLEILSYKHSLLKEKYQILYKKMKLLLLV